MSSFSEYKESVNDTLQSANIDSDNIPDLLYCRSIINGQLEYLHDLSAKYYTQQKEKESEYKYDKAVTIQSAKNPTQGRIAVDKVDKDIRAEFTKAEGMYKRVRGFLDTLENRDDILKQKISYLKQEESMNKFVKD